MSDLTQFRNHCRKRATTDPNHTYRALWSLLADEVDAYIAGDPDVIRVPEPDDQPLDWGAR